MFLLQLDFVSAILVRLDSLNPTAFPRCPLKSKYRNVMKKLNMPFYITAVYEL